MTKRALIYTRVSRDDSGEGASNDRQEEACRALALARGFDVVGVESDISISAYARRKRPAWERVLTAVREAQIDVVIAWHMDRMTRSVRDLEDLIDLSEETGVALTAVNGDIDLTNDTGRIVARILGAVARGEGERKSARQKLANQQRAAQGLPWRSGFRAYGYSLEGEVVEAEAIHIRKAATDALAGVSMKAIAAEWNSLGLRSVHAKKDALGWTNRGIRSMLVNPRYAGIATYKGEAVGAGQWTPILEQETHALLKARLTDPSRRTRKSGGGRTPEHLLSGIAICVRCGATVAARTANKIAAYGCSRGCVGTHREAADRFVLAAFEEAIRRHGPRAILNAPTSPQPTSSESAIEPLVEQRKVATAAFLRGDLPADEYEEILATITDRLDQIVRRSEAAGQTFTPINQGAEEYLEEFKSGSLAFRRAAIQASMEITLHPKGRGKRNVPIETQVEAFVRLSGELIPATSLLAEYG